MFKFLMKECCRGKTLKFEQLEGWKECVCHWPFLSFKKELKQSFNYISFFHFIIYSGEYLSKYILVFSFFYIIF